VFVRQVFENLSIIDGGVAICLLDMAPAFQRREHHEQVGCPAAFVLIIIAFGVPWLCWDRHTRLRDKLLRGLVQADHGTIRIMRPVIDLQHVFHGGHEPGVGIRRNDKLLFQVRFKNVFLHPPDRVVADPGNDVQFHDFVFQQTQRPSCAPLGRLRTGQRSEFGLGGTIEDALPGLSGRALRGQHRLEPFFHQLLTNSGNSHEAGVQCRSDPAVAPSFPCLTCIGLQQDARPGQLPRRVLATLDQAIQTLSLLRAELHDILFYSDLFRGHESAPSLHRGRIDSDILLNVNDVAD